MDYVLCDVFTDRVFGGNPLAVVPRAPAGITDDVMQAVARELNLSETVFVFPPGQPAHAARLRIFTPLMELPFAGHPTVGTTCVLLKLGLLPAGAAIVEETVGPIEVQGSTRDGRYFGQFTARQPAEVRADAPDATALAALLGLGAADIVRTGLRALNVSAGVPFLMVPLRDRAALARARLNTDLWERTLAGQWARHVYLLTTDAEGGADLQVRMFAPAMGITEDPATGGAAAALPAYFGALGMTGRTQWRVAQGAEMGRPSLIDVAVAPAANGQGAAVTIGGETVFVGAGTIDV